MYDLGFYEYNLASFVVVNILLGYLQHKRNGEAARTQALAAPTTKEAVIAADVVKWQFKKRFLPVYLLVFGSDWLQGPYIYTMYKDQKGLPEETVAHLFTTGFFAAAVSASFIGSMADRYGRKAACLFFCVSYSASCCTLLFDSIYILFVGRILGGLSTTLMYTVFESWMVTEYHRHHIDDIGGSLGDIFGIMTTLNGVVAILAGVFAEGVADFTGTQTAPFMAAVVCLFLAFGLISNHWSENYGDSAKEKEAGPLSVTGEKNGFLYIWKDKRLWALCLTSCCFEGSMYLWIFFKFPALKLSRSESPVTTKTTDLPFGIIFAVLMCAMMQGSLFFTYHNSLKANRFVPSATTLLTITLLVAAACFMAPILTHDEATTFWCFCVFEICCGIYFPIIAHLKEQIIEDGVRAKIYGIMRIPLNVFVVVGLMLTKDGLRHRENVFLVCSAALIAAATALALLVTEPKKRNTQMQTKD